MEELMKVTLSFLGRSQSLYDEAEKLFESQYDQLVNEFSNLEATPQKTKKAKSNQHGDDKENTNFNNSDASESGRPGRRPRIKKEPKDKPAVIRALEPEKRKSIEDEKMEEEKSEQSATEGNKKLDDSVELIKRKSVIIDLSDEETGDNEAKKMPPPPVPAAKTRKPRTKKQTSSQPLPIDISNVKIKEEPVEEKRPKRSKAPSKKGRSKKEEKPVEEKDDPTYGKLTPKQRKSSIESTNSQTSIATIAEETVVEKEVKKSTRPKRTRQTKADKSKIADESVIPSSQEPVVEKKNVSQTSVYEDAENDPKLFRASIEVERLIMPEIDKSATEQPASPVEEESKDESKQDSPPKPSPVKEDNISANNVNNETFVTAVAEVEPPALKPILAALDSTFNVNEPVAKEPVIAKPPENNNIHDSIMTEDLSLSEDSVPLAKLKSTQPIKKEKPNEIFNPCVPSPVKAKVDAYEKHVKESKIPVTPKLFHIPRVLAAVSQPLPHRGPAASALRDTDSPNLRMQAFASDQTGSKLVHMKKGLTSSKTDLGSGVLSSASSTSSLAAPSQSKSRSTSVEDNKRYMTALQQMAEEKKRKREEKQRLAQMNREKLEKEKREQMEKLAKEREEKAKKFLQEKAELARLEKKKQAMARLAMENNQQLKMKELHHKKLVAQGKEGMYHWNSLNSDDSTDDEGKVKKHADPPSWSIEPKRKLLISLQSKIPSRVTDQMFGLKPMSPDLKEIFPDIDPRLLKRNSSMIWKTPPRASRVFLP